MRTYLRSPERLAGAYRAYRGLALEIVGKSTHKEALKIYLNQIVLPHFVEKFDVAEPDEEISEFRRRREEDGGPELVRAWHTLFSDFANSI